MLGSHKCSVVIPTLNEEKGILHTLEIIPQFVDEIVIVDGASKDRTREIASDWAQKHGKNVKIIVESRRGYGRAFSLGFENSTGDILATVDGDGTYPIEVLAEVVKHLDDNKLDFISCSRFPLMDQASMRKRNHIGNYALTIAASVLWMHGFKDILSGMWVFRKSCLKELTLQSKSWNFSEEIKLEAYTKLGSRFAEYRVAYRERLGETKLVPWKVGIQNLSYMFAMRTGSVATLKKLFKKEL